MNELNDINFPYHLKVFVRGRKEPITIKFSVEGEAEEYIKDIFQEEFNLKPIKWTIEKIE